jgi:hypothetical protein
VADFDGQGMIDRWFTLEKRKEKDKTRGELHLMIHHERYLNVDSLKLHIDDMLSPHLVIFPEEKVSRILVLSKDSVQLYKEFVASSNVKVIAVSIALYLCIY